MTVYITYYHEIGSFYNVCRDVNSANTLHVYICGLTALQRIFILWRFYRQILC